MTATVTVVDHPLIQHKLTLMRRKETTTASFRILPGLGDAGDRMYGTK